MNALLRKEAERAEVHAFYLDTLYNDYLLAAGEITTEQQEQALVVEMLQQYCDRVTRYSPPAIRWSSAISSTISTCI